MQGARSSVGTAPSNGSQPFGEFFGLKIGEEIIFLIRHLSCAHTCVFSFGASSNFTNKTPVATATVSMSSLPTELITDILSRQPVKSLLRFRCVSKPWCSLIDGPDFIKLHLERSPQTYSHTSLILRYDQLYYLNLDSENVVKLDHPLESPNHYTHLLGSCNGLVCLCNTENDVALWNPSTRKHHILPVSPIRLSSYTYLIYGFGYDHINDDYKVLRVVQLSDDSTYFKNEVAVYSLKFNSWRRIEDFPYELCYMRDWGVSVSGALHYIGVVTDNPPVTSIVAFDLRVERYRLVPHPERLENNTYLHVGVLGECLCLMCNCSKAGINIWVMKDYGVKESWTKLICIPPEVHSPMSVFLRPFAFSKNGDAVLLERRSLPKSVELIWYDLEKKMLKNAKFHGVPKSFEAMLLVESLVSLKGNSGMGWKKQLEAEKGKKKKRDDFLSVGFKLSL